MQRSFLAPFAIAAASLILSACGARSSLAEPDWCGPWSVRDGAPGAQSHPGRFAVLDDGSVVLPVLMSIRPGSLRKIDPRGKTAWDTVIGPSSLGFTGVARDASGRLILAGTMPDGKQPVLGETLDCMEGACGFLGGLEEDRSLSWAKVLASSPPPDSAHVFLMGFSVTGDGRITVGGAFSGTLDLGCGVLAAPDGNRPPSLFLTQLSPAGECLWSRAIVHSPNGSSASMSYSIDIAVDDAGDVALSTWMSRMPEMLTIDLGGGPVPLDPTKGGVATVAKYTPNGDLVFAKVMSGGDAPTRVEVGMTAAGEVILAAVHDGTVDLGGGPRGSPGTFRSFVTKLGTEGEELWTHDLAAGPFVLPPRPLTPLYALTVDAGGSFTLAGPSVPGTTILDPPAPEMTLFVAAYDAAGELVRAQTFPRSGSTTVVQLDASLDGALVLSGQFDGTLELGPDLLEAEGGTDLFVARICR